MKSMIVSIVAAASLAACATTPVPADKLARSQGAIKSAEALNAEQVPSAALHLRLAREQMQTARKMLQDGENDRASLVLLRAEADAEAAMNLAREQSARVEAQRTIQSVQQMRAQMEGSKS